MPLDNPSNRGRGIQNSDESVIVVGAGLAGIAVSYYLSKNNIDHQVLEKSNRVGGIWSSLSWPGIRCDTEILNYSYSFRPFTSEQLMVPGKLISSYLNETSNQLGIGDNVLFETHVSRAVFSSAENRWRVFTNRGVFEARFLINANGYFTDYPYVPEFTGAEGFQGQISHLFKVTEKLSLYKKHILLVGSGASAISAAPALARAGQSLTLLQRSPSFVYEDKNQIGFFINSAQKLFQAGFTFPLSLVNFFLQLRSDLVFILFRKFPWIGKLFFRQHWKGDVDRETYDKHFCPRYNPWEQRITVATGFKALLKDKKIDMVTGKIKSFDHDGVLLEDGSHIDADVCILATGFNLCFFQFDVLIDDCPVDTRGINFYKGMMMGGIPNYFQPFGPSHTSFTRRIETVSKLVARIILYMRNQRYEKVEIERKRVPQQPKITPNYIMRDLSKLPAIYGTLELPTIDNWLYFRFRKSNFKFSGQSAEVK
jgi:monooxygenase